MKRKISYLLILMLGIAFSFCSDDENPNYPAEPSITFKSIEYVNVPGESTPDSLILTIKYRDGDGNLGFRWDHGYPFHEFDYFLASGAGSTSIIGSLNTQFFYNGGISTADFLYPEVNQLGKVVIASTRNQPDYEFLPEYDADNCKNYIQRLVAVPESHLEGNNLIDNSYNIIDTIQVEVTTGEFPETKSYFLIDEPLLYERSNDIYNIRIEFFQFANSDYEEFDWFGNYCFDFNGRFPVIGGHAGTIKSGNFRIKVKNRWEGEIRYAMTNASFAPIFDTGKIKLRVSIKDRSYNLSNVIETPDFTLQDID